MLYIFCLVTTVIYSTLVRVFGSIYCLLSPRSPKHVATFGHVSGRLAPPFNLKVECRKPTDAESYDNAIYIINHRNNYDMVTASNTVQPLTVTAGKKGLLWVPFFGQLYWLVSNLLTGRNNHAKTRDTTAEVVNHLKERRISIWMFPKGTRSCGCGLLPFKTEAFHTAIAAGIPIIPVCISTTSSKANLNRLHNGLVTVEMLPPIDASQYGRNQVRELAAHCRSIVEQKTAELDKKVAEHEATGKVQVDNLYFRGERFPARYYLSQFYMKQICHSVDVSSFRHRGLHFMQALFL